MSTARLIDRDRGYKALFKRLGEPARELSVGILDGAGGASHGAASVIDIGTIHEFGIGVDERSFIRGWYDGAASENREVLRRLGEAVIKGKADASTGLEQVGAKFAGDIQSRIAGGIAPPNRPSTVAKKGSSTPLIDTGILRSSISYKVE